MPGPIPDFPEFREPQISDSQPFHEIADQAQPVISELTFTNIYVWRDTYNFRLAMLNGNICILARPEGEMPFFLPPLGNNRMVETIQSMADYLIDQRCDATFSRVPEETAHMIADAVPEAVVEKDENNADYIYLASDLADLPGRKYHKKKNHINRFREAHDFEYRRLTPDLIPAAKELQTTWCDVRGCFTPENASLAREHIAITETLDNFEELRAVGGVILINGKVEALSIGEPLNSDTFVIHFEKASNDYHGLYQMVNQQFCADVCRSYTYVNREQDLGELGLRQAKRSYHPHHMIMKYNIRIPEEKG